MSNLLRKPKASHGKVHDISPKDAGWGYVGFGVYHLKPGETAAEATGDREVILVLVEGKADVTAGDTDFGELGDRLSVFEKSPPHAVYAPGNTTWSATATTNCVLAVCSAPAMGDYPVAQIGPNGIETTPRGKGTNTRHINNVAMEDRDVAGSLLVTEVFTPQGNWSSYPPHRHDVDDYPNMTYLEETYYHRLNPAQGYALHRIYTEDGDLDETLAVKDGDVSLVPRGHHPVGAPYGYELYYLNVMAGPRRNWRFKNDPDHDWIYQRDLKD